MSLFQSVLICMTFLMPAWSIYPGYFGYTPPATTPYFPNVIPQFPAQPLFAYSVFTRPEFTAMPSYQPPVAGFRAMPSYQPPMARSIYTAPDDTFRGYSFETEYEGGGKSNVVFVTGPQANQLLQKSLELFHKIVPQEPEQLTGRSVNTTTNATDTETTSTITTNGPIASQYQVQLYPAHTSPFTGSPIPLQNVVSSFAYSITNDIANSIKEAGEKGENAGEAQESMIHDAVVTTQSSQNKESQEVSKESQPITESPSKITTVPSTTTSSTSTTETTSSEETESNTTVASDEIMETTSA